MCLYVNLYLLINAFIFGLPSITHMINNPHVSNSVDSIAGDQRRSEEVVTLTAALLITTSKSI